jgi:hypothetical protein
MAPGIDRAAPRRAKRARGRSGELDQRGKLAEQPFDVQVTRDKILVSFRGRLVRTLTGADADEIRAAIAAGDDVQLLVARKTGNFKRGNER